MQNLTYIIKKVRNTFNTLEVSKLYHEKFEINYSEALKVLLCFD